jgi:hypothetical protein
MLFAGKLVSLTLVPLTLTPYDLLLRRHLLRRTTWGRVRDRVLYIACSAIDRFLLLVALTSLPLSLPLSPNFHFDSHCAFLNPVKLRLIPRYGPSLSFILPK